MPSEKKSPKKKVEKPSDLELAKAFALFDTDNSGELSLDELKAILCRPTKKSLTERQVARVLKKCDMDGDGQLNMEEMQLAWAQLGLSGQVQTHKDTAKSAPPSFATLIAEGNVVPDEFDAHIALERAQYLPLEKIMEFDFDHHDGLTRPQAEVIAGRVSALNDCFY